MQLNACPKHSIECGFYLLIAHKKTAMKVFGNMNKPTQAYSWLSNNMINLMKVLYSTLDTRCCMFLCSKKYSFALNINKLYFFQFFTLQTNLQKHSYRCSKAQFIFQIWYFICFVICINESKFVSFKMKTSTVNWQWPKIMIPGQ